MRFNVPQFIEVEDKIFGPLTWKQFLYTFGGMSFAIGTFMATPFLFFLLFGLPVGILSLALAFFPVNNRPFSVFLESAFNYYMSDKRYFWQKESEFVYKKRTAKKQNTAVKTSNESEKLDNLSRRLHLEAMEKEESKELI